MRTWEMQRTLFMGEDRRLDTLKQCSLPGSVTMVTGPGARSGTRGPRGAGEDGHSLSCPLDSDSREPANAETRSPYRP